jgi:hypothetical protein
MRNLALASVALALAAGCGSFPKPDARIASSEGSIRGAREAGAQSVPQASLYLKLAEEERSKAMALVRSGDYERANYLLMRAEADAELANALAREKAAKQEAEQASERVEKIKGGGAP